MDQNPWPRSYLSLQCLPSGSSTTIYWTLTERIWGISCFQAPIGETQLLSNPFANQKVLLPCIKVWSRGSLSLLSPCSLLDQSNNPKWARKGPFSTGFLARWQVGITGYFFPLLLSPRMCRTRVKLTPEAGESVTTTVSHTASPAGAPTAPSAIPKIKSYLT